MAAAAAERSPERKQCNSLVRFQERNEPLDASTGSLAIKADTDADIDAENSESSPGVCES